jgi:hypothetical protein
LLLVSSLFGYLEWGGGNAAFLFQAEGALISKIFINPAETIHPFTVLPLFGQLALVFTLFQKSPSRSITLVGVIGIGVLLVFMLIIGLLSLNFKIALSTIPFLILAFVSLFSLKRSVN